MTDSRQPASDSYDELVRETITTIEDYLVLWPAFHTPSSRLAGTRREPGRTSVASAAGGVQ